MYYNVYSFLEKVVDSGESHVVTRMGRRSLEENVEARLLYREF